MQATRTVGAHRPSASPPRRRSFGLSLAWSAASGLTLPLSALATGPVFARVLGPDGRGVVAAVTVPVFLALPVFQVGLQDATTYHTARGAGRSRLIRVAGMRLALIYGALGFTVLYLMAPVLLQNYRHEIPLLRLLSATLPLVYLQAVLRGQAQGNGQYRRVIWERWLFSLFRVLLAVGFAVLGLLSIASGAWVIWGSGIICGVALLGVPQRGRERAKSLWTEREYWRQCWALVHFGLRSWSGSLAATLVLRLDQVVLALLVSSHELGLYAVAASLADVPSTAIGAIRDMVFARSAQKGDPLIVARTCRIFLVLGTVSALVGILLTPFALPLLFGSGFRNASVMAQLLLAGTPAAVLSSLMSSGLGSAGRPGAQSACQAAGVVATVPILLVLVPIIGGRGAAIATDVAYVVTGLAALLVFTRLTKTTMRDCLVIQSADWRSMGALLRR